MSNGTFRIPSPRNETTLTHAPGTPERAALQAKLKELAAAPLEIPLVIGGQEVRTGRIAEVRAPHRHSQVLARFHQAGPAEVAAAAEAAVKARRSWAALGPHDRAAVLLKAADLASGPWRATLNAATMLGQSKTVQQAEIDSACEVIDFWRCNPHFMAQLLADQPTSSPGIWNRTEYRPLEGFVFALTPFNFTAIAANLPTAPALMGNGVVWKPASTAVLSGWYLLKVLEAAGLPPGVINFVPGPGATVGDAVLANPAFGGLHFTGSTAVFNGMWRTIAANLEKYRGYPRIVGETGGQGLRLPAPVRRRRGRRGGALPRRLRVPGAEVLGRLARLRPALALAGAEGAAAGRGGRAQGGARRGLRLLLLRGDRQGGLHPDQGLPRLRPRHPRPPDPRGRHLRRLDRLVRRADGRRERRIRAPGSMQEEIFGPVLTLCVYDDARLDEAVALCDATSPYALTGAVFARDRAAMATLTGQLSDAAGNFYLNDKPTGAVVGQQPFGGARASGTNDKAGSLANLIRWTSIRSLKENFDPPRSVPYPHQREG